MVTEEAAVDSASTVISCSEVAIGVTDGVVKDGIIASVLEDDSVDELSDGVID